MKIPALVIAILFTCIKLPAQTKLASLPVAKHRFIVVAHRGDHIEVPENTLAAYQMAVQHGVDFVEIDLRTTKDSVLVILHDATIDRTTNGHGKVKDLTYHELSSFKILNKASKDTAQFNIPTFEDVLRFCKDKINIYLDFKDADIGQTYALIKKYRMENNVIVYINSETQFAGWRKLVPSMPLMISLPDEINTAEKLTGFLQKHPVELLDGDYKAYTAEMIKAAREMGTKVLPDIQSSDEANNWESAMQLEFDGLQTDHPAMLIEFLQSKQKR